MRKVKFKKFIPREHKKEGGLVEGTGKFEVDFTHEGLFHCWGIEYEEYEDGLGNSTVAIIEMPDGTIENVFPNRVKFINESKATW